MSEKKFIHVEEDGYRVGYGKPPKHTQFKKGQSGNPRGRGSKSRVPYEEDEFPLRRMMMEPVVVTINGKKEKLPRYEVVMMSIANKAMAGDHKSQKLLVDISGGFTGFREEWKRQKTKADEELVEWVLKEANAFGKDEIKTKNDGDHN